MSLEIDQDLGWLCQKKNLAAPYLQHQIRAFGLFTSGTLCLQVRSVRLLCKPARTGEPFRWVLHLAKSASIFAAHTETTSGSFTAISLA
jgi:hypothetical protein